jgi:shikimate dehydrogenase
MKNFGLIGKKLGHSFSQSYFESKWNKEEIQNCSYKLFEIADISELPEVIKKNDLSGLNVTVPYKEDVIPFVTEMHSSATKVGAVNVLAIDPENKVTGYNSDYFGFRQSLENWISIDLIQEAFILGTGGASKAVQAVLKDLDIEFQLVSRTQKRGTIGYDTLSLREENILVINTTPLGMYPNTDTSPDIPYHQISHHSYLYDLVYNPEETLFMRKGMEQGAAVKNGLEMLQLQAEKSWEIWTS